MAHGAKENIKDIYAIKSEYNQDYWMKFFQGLPVEPTKQSFAYNKFMFLLKGMGVDPIREGNNIKLKPMTDKQIEKLSAGELKEPEKMFDKNGEPLKHGLFDIHTTGGPSGKNITHIKLAKKLPNPVYETAITAILGITKTEYENIILRPNRCYNKITNKLEVANKEAIIKNKNN